MRRDPRHLANVVHIPAEAAQEKRRVVRGARGDEALAERFPCGPARPGPTVDGHGRDDDGVGREAELERVVGARGVTESHLLDGLAAVGTLRDREDRERLRR
jgi:hypothetical protein